MLGQPHADGPDMPVIRSATAPDHPEVQQEPEEGLMQKAELTGVTLVKRLGNIQLGMALPRGIRSQSADPAKPASSAQTPRQTASVSSP